MMRTLPAPRRTSSLRFEQATAMSLLAGGAQEAGKRLWREWNDRRTWKLSISAEDDLYLLVHQWLMDHDDGLRRRALVARTHYASTSPEAQSLPELRFLIDGETSQRIVVDGHPLRVYVENGDSPSPSGLTAQPAMSSADLRRPPKLVFQARTQAGRDAVVALMERLDRERTEAKRQPGLMVLDRWSQWTRRSDLPSRSMDSVIVRGGVLEDLYRDLRQFRDREGDYVRRAIPYHRAYLLAGPPGTGKTSAVKAITNALRMDLWYAQLSGIHEDVKLVDLLGEVRPHGVLLLEDIDSLTAAVSREGGPAKDISAAGLLNALDGVATPHGLVTVLTTNYPERLDSALLRPGRVDRVLTFEHPDSATIVRHFAFFYGSKPRARSFPEHRSSAELSEIFKQHMDDPAAAEAALLVFRAEEAA